MPRLPAALAALSGAVYGFSLARLLFEAWPAVWACLRDWPGALALAGLAGLVFLALTPRGDAATRAPARFAALALLLTSLNLFSPAPHLLRALTLHLGALGLYAWLRFNRTENPVAPAAAPGRLWEAGLGILLSLLYLRTLAPTVGEADAFEFQVCAARLGIAHGNGYPLLILLGWLFSHIPVGGTLAFRVNLTTAAAAIFAALGVQRLARRLGAAPAVAFLGALTYGVSYSLWARATEIETYPLNAVFLAALLWVCLDLLEPAAAPRSLYTLAFLFGLGITNHLTTILLAPAGLVAGSTWLVARYRSAARPSPLTFLWLLLAFLLGLSVYLYLPLRWPAVNHGELLTPQKFWYFFTGGEARGMFDPFLPFHDFSRYGRWAEKIVGEFTPMGFGLALAGAAALLFTSTAKGLRRWLPAVVIGLMYAAHAYFALAYNTREPDWSDFFVSLHLLTALLLTLGSQFILERLARWQPGAAVGLLVVVCLLPLALLWQNLPKVDRSQAWGNYYWGQYTLQQPLAPQAAILVDPPHMAPLYYPQVVEHRRPDLDILLLPNEDAYRAVLEERLAAGQTVYLARYLSGLGSFYSLRSVGPLAEISPQPFTAPVSSATPLSVTLGNTLQLLGYQTDPAAPPVLNAQPLTLYWRTGVPADNNYLVHLRLRSESTDAVVWQNAGQAPVNGLYPTNAWRPGETISDFYLIPFEPGLAPGTYLLEVGLFPPFQAAETGWTAVLPITRPAPTAAPEPARVLRAQFGQQWLLGYAAPESVTPGSNFKITLYWLRDANSTTVTAFDQTHTLTPWPTGAMVPVTYPLTAPTTGAAFTPVIQSGPTTRCGWLSPPTANCRLPAIRLVGAAVAADAINFDQQLLLRQATIENTLAHPGDVINVDLEWQGLQTIPEDYTVFVQLVGPDGLPHGQIDYWPQGGTLKTSAWAPGAVIRDPYQVPLPADAPPGQYTVHVGMYLLATMQRLPVLNSAGFPVDDKVVLPGLTVQ